MLRNAFYLAFLLCVPLVVIAGQNPADQKPAENAPPAGQGTAPKTDENAPPASPSAVSVPAIAPVDPKTFVIGAEDTLLIQVWREPELTRPVLVRPDGKINLPLIREIQAS